MATGTLTVEEGRREAAASPARRGAGEGAAGRPPVMKQLAEAAGAADDGREAGAACEGRGAGGTRERVDILDVLPDGGGEGAPPGEAGRPDRRLYRAFKRASDIVLAGAGLVALSPVMLAAAVAVKATSPGPVIFRQLRFGKDGRPFVCYKFRSMKVDVPDDVPTSVMNEDSSAMTPVGAFLRKSSIDELPQLVNIIKGDMSVIGPRPMILSERDQVEERELYGANDIRPGLTGLAQVCGRDEVSMERKARLDGAYRQNMGPAMDAACFIKSVEVVAHHSGYASGSGGRGKGAAPTPRPGGRRRPKLLVVTQHYWPEPFNFSDICEGLAERGCDVTVLTGLPNYPEGRLYDGYSHGKRRYETKGGVRIIRAPLVPRGEGVVRRVANYFSFSASASRMAGALESSFDAVLAFQTSPVMMAEPALAYARKTGAPVLLWCIDIWPECLTAGGIAAGGAPYRLFERVSGRIYRAADRLAVTSPRFKGYMEEKFGIDPSSVADLPQYAEDIFGRCAGSRPEGYDPSRLNLTFAGNVGSAQSVETMVEAAAVLRDDPRFLFHVVGSGSSEEGCRELAGRLGLSNVVFHGRRPLEEMPSFYQASDAMVATFADNPVLGYTLPRKIQSYLAAGRPVLGAVGGEAARVVDEACCGLSARPGDSVGLAAAAAFAEQPPEVRAALGESARRYYLSHFTKERFFETLEGLVRDLVESKERV